MSDSYNMNQIIDFLQEIKGMIERYNGKRK